MYLYREHTEPTERQSSCRKEFFFPKITIICSYFLRIKKGENVFVLFKFKNGKKILIFSRFPMFGCLVHFNHIQQILTFIGHSQTFEKNN